MRTIRKYYQVHCVRHSHTSKVSPKSGKLNHLECVVFAVFYLVDKF